jgi:hypothetical protein
MAKTDFKVNAVTSDGESVQISPENVGKARDKGWAIEGVPFRKPDGSALGEPVVVSVENVDKARARGWALEGDATEGVPESIAAPDDASQHDMRADVVEAAHELPAPAPLQMPDPMLAAAAAAEASTPTDEQLAAEAAGRGEHATQRSFTDIDTALADPERIGRERVAREQREADEAAFQAEHGIGLTSEKAVKNLVQTGGEVAARVPMLGFDAPMAGLEAAGQWVAKRLPTPDSETFDAATSGPFNPDGKSQLEHLQDLGASADLRPVDEARFRAGGGDAGRPDAPTIGEEFDASRAAIAARKEANPKFSVGTEIAGNIGLGLLTGGSSLAAKGGATGLIARLAAKTPTGLLARKAAQAGIWAGSSVAPAAEAVGLSGALPRIIAAPAFALATEGAVEGTVTGAAQSANQAWLNDDYDGVWDLVSAAGAGAKTGLEWGFGLGAALGLGKGVNAARKGAEASADMLRASRLVPESTGDIEDILPVPPADATMQYPEPATSGAQSAAQRALKLTPEQSKKLRDGAFTRVNENATKYARLRDELNEELDIAAKREYAIKVGEPNARFTFSSARSELGLDQPYFKRIAEDPALIGNTKSQGIVRRLEKQLDGLEKSQRQLEMNGQLSEGQVHSAMDQAKRYVQQARSQANDLGQALLFDELEPADTSLIDFMQSDVAWSPKVAEINRIVNPPMRKAISASKDGLLSGAFTARGENLTANPYDLQRQANPAFWNGHMSAVGTPQEAPRVLAVQRMLRSDADDIMNRARLYGNKRMRQAADEMTRAGREIESDLGQVTQWNTNTGEPADAAKAIGVFNNIPGAAYAAEKVADKLREKAYQQSIETIDKIDRAASLRGLYSGAKPNKALTVAEKLAPTAAENTPDVVNYVQRMVAWGPDDQEKHDNAMAEIERVYGPQMAAISAQKLEAQRQFLTSRSGNPESPADRAKLYRYGDAAFKPLNAIDRIASGLGTPEDRETVQTLYPSLWKRFVEGAIKTMNKRERSYKDRVRASRALGVPMDQSMEPARFAQLQQLAGSNPAAAQQQQQQGSDEMLSPSRRSAPDMASIVEQ